MKNRATRPMHMPIATNTLRLSRAATSGRPRNKSVMSNSGCKIREWIITRTSGLK